MTHSTHPLRSPLAWGVFAALAGFFLAACFGPASTACKTGLVCPDGTQCSDDGKTCIQANRNCGNGVINPGEMCDDGNTISGDGCNSECTSTEVCGNGFTDPNEVCDDGNKVSGDGCSANCQSKEVCGNGILDTAVGEICDDGNKIDGDGCSADCRSKETCGNGVLDDKFPDPARNEACDDKNLVAGDGCSPDCKVEGCGNGILNPGEVCDDGNTVGGDGCSANCRSNETCGNGIVDALRGEKCDDGNTVGGDGCSADCLSTEICGNKYVDSIRGEVCDDGNTDGGDGCSADCRSTEVCGNKYVDVIRGEVCDDGNTDGGDGCSTDCRSTEVCGNGYRDVIKGEVCDDGNTVSGDGCSSDCRSTETCGNGVIDTAVGEVCDDGNTSDGPDGGTGDGCSANCRSNQTCGNGIIDFIKGEVCDDGNTASGDGCSSNCKSTERCGNGIVDTAVGEVCDDGNTSNTYPDGGLDTCAADCKSGLGCGNGIRDPGEECDDGNTTDDDNCKNDCTLNFCGDGKVDLQAPRIEQCDTVSESLTCNANCTLARCGDGLVNVTRGEQCDVDGGVGNLDGGAETTTCDTDCTVAFCGDGTTNVTRGEQCDTAGNSFTCDSNCTFAVCGDGFLNPAHGEECDQGPRDTASCDDDCTAVVCGDGHPNTDAGEQCDTGGAMSNSAHCRPGCVTNVCGDGFRDLVGPPVEACDDGNTTTETNCPYGQASCTLCNSNCSSTLSLTGAFCGDGVRNGLLPDGGLIEKCDDGNTITETICPYSDAGTCTFCDNSCQTVLNLTGPRCGDGVRNGPLPDGGALEPCDDGNTVTETNCPYGQASCNLCNASCSAVLPLIGAFCGDGTVNGLLPDGGVLEKCDDGNAVTETTCPYSDAGTCTGCDSTCQTILSLTGPRCGDGIVNGPLPDGGLLEVCDDGNTTTETECPYGVASCTRCDATCSTVLNLTGPVCGDGLVHAPEEACDDGNTLACGGCNANCTVAQPPGAASGSISTVKQADLLDGETFTLGDGIKTVVFEFDHDPLLSDGGFNLVDPVNNVRVDLTSGGNTATVAGDKIVAAINSYDGGLDITAVKSGVQPYVLLTNGTAGPNGNVAITETVSAVDFTFAGMSGGSGYDCGIDAGCTLSSDCAAPNTCKGGAKKHCLP